MGILALIVVGLIADPRAGTISPALGVFRTLGGYAVSALAEACSP